MSSLYASLVGPARDAPFVDGTSSRPVRETASLMASASALNADSDLRGGEGRVKKTGGRKASQPRCRGLRGVIDEFHAPMTAPTCGGRCRRAGSRHEE